MTKSLLIQEILYREGIKILFQPIIDSNKEIVAVEALSRGILDNKIIPANVLFEDTSDLNQLKQIDCLCRRKAIEEFSKLVETSLTLFINCETSCISMYNPANMACEVIKNGIDPKQVLFEIVEREELVKSIRDFSTKCYMAGFSIGLDDITSQEYIIARLEDASPKLLKIDRSLISHIDSNLGKQKQVEQLISIGHMLNAKVLAEGVETKKELDYCIKANIDLFQGYYIYKPLSLEKLKECLVSPNYKLICL